MKTEYPVSNTPSKASSTSFKDHLNAWLVSDCENKLCIDGGVTVDDGEHSIYYRCPLCNRSNIPSAAIYAGPYETWTVEEMERRLKDRKDVYFDKNYRHKRGKEIVSLLQELTGARR